MVDTSLAHRSGSQDPSNGPTKTPSLPAKPSSPSASSHLSLPLTDVTAVSEPNLNFGQLLGRRNGSVLGRDIILKSEHFFKGVNAYEAELQLMGAPNFRSTNLSIFGAAQPTTTGLATILRVLLCGTGQKTHKKTLWFSTREEPIIYINDNPYVLRDVSNPFVNIKSYSGISAGRLESVEKRLKNDIVHEAKRNAGLLLVHDERGELSIEPCLVAVESVRTPKEVFADLQERGFSVEYHRIPVSHEQSPTDPYIDEYFRILSAAPTDWPIVFSCGMGIGRTTYAMVIGLLIRRAKIIHDTNADPFHIAVDIPFAAAQRSPSSSVSLLALSASADSDMEESPAMSSTLTAPTQLTLDPSERSRTILRLVYIIEQALHSRPPSQTTIDWLMARSAMIDSLEAAINGNYNVINDLLRVLSNGPLCKRIVDTAVDRCASVVNLREHILLYRVRYMNDCANGACINANLDTGLGFLERYFSLIAFSEFVEQQQHRGRLGQSQRSFQSWMQDHREIWHMLSYIRNSANKLKAFRPLEENLFLSAAKPMAGATALFKSPHLQPPSEDAIVVKTRSGTVLSANTILKIDHWPKEQMRPASDSGSGSDSQLFANIAGAPNFRRIPFSSDNYSVYAVAQPTAPALQSILRHLRAENPAHTRCIWINVREEPLVYVNGEPYVLRDQHASLRNIKAYTGISTRRLEQMEQRLRDDVLAEAASYSGRILLHSEGPEQHILPIWETAEAVLTMREVFDTALEHAFEQVQYHRVPITAEEPPEPADFDAFRRIIANTPSKCILVFNCQMGVGRSTTGAVIATQILSSLNEHSLPSSLSTASSSPLSTASSAPSSEIHYKVVSTVVRMLKNGAESKRIVDRLVDAASSLISLRTCIEEYRLAANRCTFDKQSCRKIITKGLLALRRYVLLILFESYELSEAGLGAEARSFAEWFGEHPEFGTVFQELGEGKDLDGLAILTGTVGDQDATVNVSEEACECRGEIPMNYELVDKCQVRSVVEGRKGAVLAPMTILKFDHFIGCQKMSLPERIEGAPNFRKVSLDEQSGKFVCGLAMPTKDAIARVLGRIGCLAGSPRRCLWVSMREEPVIFFNSLPYVLRIVKDPIVNLEMTGIVSERVELMEERLRAEAAAETALYDGHILLHEEEISAQLPLGFEVVPRWEAVNELCSPAQAYQAISECAIDYVRVPVTDEQAPIPIVFDELLRLVSNEAYTDFIFNCQMGRGRTTTGMVITMLFYRIKAKARALTCSTLSRANSTASQEAPPSTNSPSLEVPDNATFLRGEYKLIMKLCQLLEFGQAAKQIVDECIDACSHMQNLREAIFDFKQHATLHPNHPDHHRGISYLLRYFYLIAFAEFLLELHQQSPGLGSGSGSGSETQTSFLQWINERREITNLAHPDRGELGFH